jgi:diguanylate cyclase (GGDEF)-like protein/PAS domain S-box-containing protein
LSPDTRPVRTAQAESSNTHLEPSRRRLLTDIGRLLLVAAAYFLTARASMQFSSMSAHISFVWLAAGVSLAALLLGGLRLAPGVAAGAFAAQYTVGGSAWMCVMFALGSVLSGVAGTWLLQRKLAFSRALDHPRHVLSLICVGAFLSPIIAATFGAAGVYWGHLDQRQEWEALWAVWWAGDALGVLLLAPMLLSWTGTPTRVRALRRPILLLVILQLLVGGYVFALRSGSGGGAYVYLSLALLTAMHLPLTWVTLLNLLTFAAAASATMLGTGPFASASLQDGLASLQTYGIVSSLATLLLSSLAQERESVAAELNDSLERFQQLTALSSDWYWEQDEKLRFTRIAGRAVEERRVREEDLIGLTRWEADANDVDEEARRAHDAAVVARAPFRDIVMSHHNTGAEPSLVSISGAPLFDRDGRFRGYRGIARDITLQKRAEREIEEAKRFLDALINAIPTPVLVKDEQHRYIAVNPSFCGFFRNPAEQILGKTDYDFFAPQDAAFYQQTDDEALGGRSPVKYERPYTIGEDIRWMLVRKSALTRPDGSRVVVLVLIDVTERRAAEEQLRASEQRFRSLTELSADWYWEQDADLRFTFFSAGTTGKTITPLAELIGKTRFELDIEWESAAARDQHRQALAARLPFKDLVFRDRHNGRCALVSGEPVFDANGAFTGYRGVARDVTAQQQAEQALRESETRFRDFAAAAGEYVWEAGLDGRLTYVSSRVQSVWGYSDQELTGRAPTDFMPPGEAERVREWVRHNMRPDGSFNDLEHMIVDRHGETRWVLINAVGIFDSAGQRIGQRGTGRDITDRKTAEARISYLATRDPLTELPNRVLFNDRLEQGIVAARRTGQSLALLFIDLDRFKNINDSLGHQVGDLLLREVANRMHGCIRKGDTLSRLGGDEFVVTLEGLQQAEDAAQVAAKIIKALSRPCEIAGHTLNTSCSIGISIYPLDAEDDRALMKNADTAMYHAKEKGRDNYQFFSPEMNVRAVERHTLETALRAGLERQEFTLYYQPLVDLRSGKIVGMEALLRWQHPERGVLSPATFMAVAEESGLIEPIGQWVLRTACQRAKAWLDNGYPPLKVAVNISPRELIRPREFARGISRILSSTGLDPRYLELEMTESLLVQNAEENIAVLRKLGQEGVRIAVDDFGTGYSSLSYLRQLPIDTLKIDRSFVRDIERDPKDVPIIRAIVAMAHSLGLQVTAEGVETRGQLDALARLDCDEYQGYLFSKPLPAVEIAARFLAPGELNFEAREAG